MIETFDEMLASAENEDSDPDRKALYTKEKADLQYQNLLNQLNPHFLFNSLSTLESLIYSDQKLAAKFLNQLTRVYRYILNSRTKQVVTLDEEVKFMKDYTDLLQTRFGKGLLVMIDLPTQRQKYQIIPTSLQILVENATRHNITDAESPLVVKVFLEEPYLVIENNLQKKNIIEQKRIMGLSNLGRLYHLLSSTPIEIQETDRFFIVKLPLL